MNITKFVIPLAIAGSLISQTVLAQATLSLNQIMPLIKQSQKLNTEVKNALKQAGKKPSDISCTGNKLGAQFGPLSATNTAPFTCNFGTKKLTIQADNLVTLRNGHTIFLNQFSELQPKPDKASVTFRLKTWKWQ